MTTTCLRSGLSDETWEFCRPGEQPAVVCPRDAGEISAGQRGQAVYRGGGAGGGAITPDTAFDGVIEDNKWLPAEAGWDGGTITRVSDSGSAAEAQQRPYQLGQHLFRVYCA
jgi:hypothetical protein